MQCTCCSYVCVERAKGSIYNVCTYMHTACMHYALMHCVACSDVYAEFMLSTIKQCFIMLSKHENLSEVVKLTITITINLMGWFCVLCLNLLPHYSSTASWIWEAETRPEQAHPQRRPEDHRVSASQAPAQRTEGQSQEASERGPLPCQPLGQLPRTPQLICISWQCREHKWRVLLVRSGSQLQWKLIDTHDTVCDANGGLFYIHHE